MQRYRTTSHSKPERVKFPRQACERMLEDPAFPGDIKKKRFELDPTM